MREKLGLSQAALAGLLGVHEITVLRWEQGKTAPKGRVLEALEAVRANPAAAMQRPVAQPKPSARGFDALPLTIGVCSEFMDTSWPILAAAVTGTFASTVSVPVVLRSAPWDDRCLDALRNELFDIVVYNEFCTSRFRDYTGARFVSMKADKFFRSGEFYIAFRLAPKDRSKVADKVADDEKTTKRLLDLLFDRDTVKIIPPADMEHAVSAVAGHLGKEGQDVLNVNRDYKPPGGGVEMFIEPMDVLRGRTLVYVGGQDQRSALQRAAEGGRGKPWEKGELIILTQSQLAAHLGIEIPASLSRNLLITRESRYERYLAEIHEAIERALDVIKCDKDKKQELKYELIRWCHTYGTRFEKARFTEARDEVSRLLESESELTGGFSEGTEILTRYKVFTGDEARAREQRNRAS